MKRSHATDAAVARSTQSDDVCDDGRNTLERLQRRVHANCLFCGAENPFGFNLDFQVARPGKVRVRFGGGSCFQSYPETLHGGMISALLDAVMTNALFSLGVEGVTGELTVRFLRQVALDREVEAVGIVETADKPLYRLSACMMQGGRIAARASAKFVDRGWAAAIKDATPDAPAYERRRK